MVLPEVTSPEAAGSHVTGNDVTGRYVSHMPGSDRVRMRIRFLRFFHGYRM